MAYEYGSDSKLLELPNPYRLQNLLLWICAALLTAAGVMCLLLARNAISEQQSRQLLAPLATGVVLLLAGIAAAATAARRLRFYFGRGRPASLAPEIPVGAVGGSPAADAVKETLRQGGLTYPEPSGPIAGLLYHAVPTLITAPLAVQQTAQRFAFNLAAIAATLLSFVLSWAFGSDATRPWTGLLYFVFGLVFIARPVLTQQRAKLSSVWLVVLIVAAVLVPVGLGLLGPKLPPLGGLSVAEQTFTMLGTALAACLLGMFAVLAQVDGAPQTRASVVQQRLSMNAPPAVLMEELDRTLQSQWSERIPNRRYARIDPQTNAATPSGSFAGELFDETQPLPLEGSTASGLGVALAQRRHRPLVLLDFYATLLTIAGIALALGFVRGFDPAAGFTGNRFALLGTASILGFVALFCFRSAAQLWGRFDFASTVVWVEMAGNFQTSRIGTGNNFTSRMNTENTVVRTEAMTLRVWRARVESVVFGKDGARQLTAMFSTEQEAQALADHLAAFARSQSVLVAPGSGEDERRIAALNAGEQAMAAPQGAVPAAQLAQQLHAAAALTSMGQPTPAPRFCAACGHAAQAGARFCSNCAAPLAA